MAQTFFVTGATGTQGGYVTRQLLDASQKVHVISRNPDGEASRDLEALGVKVFKGDFSNVESMKLAATGCIGAFINVSPDMTDPLGELKQIRNVIEACQKAGVKKVVQSAVGGLQSIKEKVEKDESMIHIRSFILNKLAVEEAIQNAGFESWTILHYSRLLNTYVAPFSTIMFPTLTTEQTIKTALRPNKKQWVLDPFDIGRIAKEAFLNESGKFKNIAVDLSSAELTFQDIVNLMNAALGDTKVKLYYYTVEEVQQLVASGNPFVVAELQTNSTESIVDRSLMAKLGFEPTEPGEFFKREIEKFRQAIGEN